MSDLPRCTLCEQFADPRMGLLTKGGDYYPLCDGCAPAESDESISSVADKCRSSGRIPSGPLGQFGFNEPRPKPAQAKEEP